MNVYVHDFALFRGSYYSVITVDLQDSLLVSEDERDLVDNFFETSYYFDSRWENVCDYLWDDIYTNAYGLLIYENRVLIADRETYLTEIRDLCVINGYMLIYIEVSYDIDCYALLIVNVCDMGFVGFVSSRCGTISSPELARFILATPEIDWNI